MASSLQVGTSPNNLKDLPVEPDKLDWGLNDISSDDAGRVKDAKCTMYKNRIAQKRKIALGWSNPTFAQVSALMRMFAPEYLYVRCKDPLDGGWATHEFYTGD
ncbi:hypothetical protein, partial [Adlercreutzia caecimuris]|uniref:hypothetical protein n=1 Tax=Adlercreutzia caecimuris TaxID=671266 RepID=UPI002729CA96